MRRMTTCDGVSRRDFLTAGAIAGSSLSLAALLRLEAEGAIPAEAAGKNVIHIYLPGGQSHLDTWDMKPEADAEVVGEFKPTATNVPGLDICELMPRLAQQADKYAVLRAIHHTLAAHQPGQDYLRTGNAPVASLEYPDVGSVVAREHAAPKEVPPYVSLPAVRSNDVVSKPGYLGVAYSPFAVAEDPNEDDFSVRALSNRGGLSKERITSRFRFMQGLDTAFREAGLLSQPLEGMDRFYEQAYDILQSEAARSAFDIGTEDEPVREQYGRTRFGQTCLLARRLVEVGVRCVSIDFGGWDTHRDNFKSLKETLLPPFDAGVAALLEDLSQRGLLENTVVWVTGEFGRTPKVNDKAGRDHWPRAMSMIMAGGGIRGGQVIGATNRNGEEPTEAAYRPDDAAASFFAALGIDPHKEYETPTGRPVMIVRDGNPIQELFA